MYECVPGPTPSNSPVVPQTEAIVAASASGSSSSSLQMPAMTSLTPEQKQELASKFSLESGLKLNWSVECLEANQWDYNRAATDFQRAKVTAASLVIIATRLLSTRTFLALEILPTINFNLRFRL